MGTLRKILKFLGVFVILACANFGVAHAEFSIYVTINDNGATTASQYSGLYYNADDTACDIDRYYDGLSCKYTKVIEFTAPTKTGFKYLGHYTLQTGGRQWAEPIANGKARILQGYGPGGNNPTVYAHWRPIKITLNHQNATTNGVPDILYLKAGTDGGWYRDEAMNQPITALDTVPHRTGYTFLGYFTTQHTGGVHVTSISGDLYTSQQVLNAFTDDATIYARWIQNHTVTLNPNGGTPTGNQYIYTRGGNFYADSEGTNSITSSIFNSIANGGANITPVTRSGYTFNGYYDAASGGTQMINSAGLIQTSSSFNSSQIWYAQYQASCDSTIVLEMNGGTLPTDCETEFRPLQNGTNWEFPDIPSRCKPTRNGYTFNGYVYNDTTIYNGELTKMVTNYTYCEHDKLVLTAQWQANGYTATFDCSYIDGMINSPELENLTGIHLGDTIPLPPTSLCKPNPAVVPECGITGAYAITPSPKWSYHKSGVPEGFVDVTSGTDFEWPIANNIGFVLRGYGNEGTTVKYDCGAVGGTAPENQYVNYLNCDNAELSAPAGCTPGDGIEFTGWKYGNSIYQPGQIIGELWTRGLKQLRAQWRCTEPGQVFNQQTGTCESQYTVQVLCDEDATPIQLTNLVYGSQFTIGQHTADWSKICISPCGQNETQDGWDVFIGDPLTLWGESPMDPQTLITVGTTPDANLITIMPHCVTNTNSVRYMCYNGDPTGQTDQATATNYTVRAMDWYEQCDINNNVPVPDYKWHFSGNGRDYSAGDIIPSWTYGNNQTFTPAYTATFNCNNNYWQTPTDVSVPTAQSVLLGGELIMPDMPCEVNPEYDGWLETNYTWETSYTQNLTSPVPGAQCQISDLHYEPGNPFPWNCPTDLTFEPLTKFINKPITVSCGGGIESETYTMTFENQDEIKQKIIYFFGHSCGGHCPLDNPSGPHGYNNKIVCATDWGNQQIPDSWEPIENDAQGRICYKTDVNVTAETVIESVDMAQITDLDISNITHCPQRVTYKCSEDATDGYNGAPYAVFEREYTTQTPETVGCESGLAFDTWKNLDDNQTFTAGQLVSEWPYEDPVTLVAQWGGANTYDIIYHYDSTASWNTGNHPDTYTVNDLPLTINGVMTRQNSIFIGWCDDQALTQNCGTPRVIPAGTTGTVHFWAKWECEHPYHIDPDTGACAVCDDDQYWDEEANICSTCPTEFKHSKSGFNWSINQCYRECPSNTLLGDANHRCDSNPNLWDMESCNVIARFEDFQNSTGKQIEFKGNSDAGINTCNNPDNVYCPRGFMGCPNAQPYKPMTTRVDFHGGLDGQTLVGTRYIFGSRQSGEGLDIVNGKLWSSLDGPAQKVERNGSPNYYYTHIIYPAETAPDATVQGYTFNGYYYPISNGTRYVGSDYGLNGPNAASVLNGQPGDYSQTRHLYATLENGGYTQNEYTITYKPNYDGATESDVTQNVTYGATFTTKPAGTFHRPGYEMTAWGAGPNQPNTPYPELEHTYTYVTASDVNLFAQWEMCAAGTYAGETETQCTNCPEEYPLSVAGASAIGQCYKNCSVQCTTVECPANSTCTQTNTMYNGTQYYGGACDAVPQNCEITEIICDAGFYLNGTVCEPCPNGTTSPAGSTSATQCSACPDGQYIDNETCTDCPDGFDHSDANATSQSQCYHDCETPCTEPACPANSTSCTYGTAPNSGAWYFGTDACNATPLVCPIESVTCAGGYGWNPTNNTCEPCTGNEASINNSCEPCPDGTQPNAGHTACVPCPDGTAGTNGTCEPCAPGYVPNAQATECEPCPAGTYWENGICEPCPEDYSSVQGSVGLDACFLAACPTGQHIAHGACEDDVIICDAPYAETATRTWNPTLGAYGSCQIQECEDGYHVASNACVPNDQLCNVANGRGERAWNGTQWGNCVVTECDPGFEPNASNTACGRCGNYMGADGQPAVSSYITGCEIATCMYQGQKYALENGECRPICNKPDDGTGHMEWNESTKKCVRTCNPGYKMW